MKAFVGSIVFLLSVEAAAQPEVASELLGDVNRSPSPVIPVDSSRLDPHLGQIGTAVVSLEGIQLMLPEAPWEFHPSTVRTARWLFVISGSGRLWRLDGRSAASAGKLKYLADLSVDDAVAGAGGLFVRSDRVIAFVPDQGRGVRRAFPDVNDISLLGASDAGALVVLGGDDRVVQLLSRDLEPLAVMEIGGGLGPSIAIGSELLVSVRNRDGGVVRVGSSGLRRVSTRPAKCFARHGEVVVGVTDAGLELFGPEGAEQVLMGDFRCPLFVLDGRIAALQCDGGECVIFDTEDGISFRMSTRIPQPDDRSLVTSAGADWFTVRGQLFRLELQSRSASRVADIGQALVPVQPHGDGIETLIHAQDRLVRVVYGPAGRISTSEVSDWLTEGSLPSTFVETPHGAAFVARVDLESDGLTVFQTDGTSGDLHPVMDGVVDFEAEPDGSLWALVGTRRTELVRRSPDGGVRTWRTGLDVHPLNGFVLVDTAFGRTVHVEGGWFRVPSEGDALERIAPDLGQIARVVAFEDGAFAQAGSQIYFFVAPDRRTEIGDLGQGELQFVTRTELGLLAVSCDDGALLLINPLGSRRVPLAEPLGCNLASVPMMLGGETLFLYRLDDEVRLAAVNASGGGPIAEFGDDASVLLFSSAVLGGQAFFAAVDEAGGRELFTSDGTTQGTKRVADIRPGPLGSNVMKMAVVGDQVLFWAYDGVAWSIFGTDGGQVWKLSAPHPAFQGSGPGLSPGPSFARAGENVVHTAFHPRAGIEPHSFPLERLECRGCCQDEDCESSDPCMRGVCEAGVCRAEPLDQAPCTGDSPNENLTLATESACGCALVEDARWLSSPVHLVLLLLCGLRRRT